MKKRICAVIMSLLLAVNLVGVPKAKAVVSEGALLGSIFGSLLVSLGYSWVADNFDAPSFGEAIYDLIKQCDEEMDTGIQLLIDSNLTGLVAAGPGKLQLNYQWVSLARSFADWFQSKFFTDSNSSAVLSDGTLSFVGPAGTVFNLLGNVSDVDVMPNYAFTSVNPNVTILYGGRIASECTYCYSDSYSLIFKPLSDGGCEYGLINNSDSSYTMLGKNGLQEVLYSFAIVNGYLMLATKSDANSTWKVYSKYLRDLKCKSADLNFGASLTAEKPAEVHYPDVAEDGSQVYEITVDGVTATDIEGIIQGAVDQILAGTAAIAGEVTQAQDVPVEPEAPAAGEYAVPGLETIFPFCIPFDIYAFCSALNAEPVAPSFEWRMQYAPLGLDYTFEIDLSAFDGVAQILRTMELLAFCVGLAFWTRHLIRG